MLLAIYQIVIFLRYVVPQKVKTLCLRISDHALGCNGVTILLIPMLLCGKYGSNCDIPTCDSLFSHPIHYSRVNSKQVL